MNRYQIAKQIQKRFWDDFELIITRDQALEVMYSLKDSVGMFGLNGRYVTTRGTDDINGASKRGVQYSAYKTFYSVREWNNAMMAGEFGKVNNLYAELWHNGEYYIEPEERERERERMTTFNIPLAIDAAYNPGEWRLSRQVIGPRGGKKWVTVYSTSATGGYLPDAQLEPGLYKITYWSNGWPLSRQFEVTADGQVIDEDAL